MKSLLSLLLICGLATLGAYLAGEHLPLDQWLHPLFIELRQAGLPWMGQSLLWVLATALPAGFAGGILLSFYARLAGGIGFFKLLLAAAVSLVVLRPDQVQSLLQDGLAHPPYLMLLGADLLIRALLLKRFSGGGKEKGETRSKAQQQETREQLADTLRQAKSAGQQASTAASGWTDSSFQEERTSVGRQPKRKYHQPLRKTVRRSHLPRSWGIEKVRQTGPVGIERSWRS